MKKLYFFSMALLCAVLCACIPPAKTADEMLPPPDLVAPPPTEAPSGDDPEISTPDTGLAPEPTSADAHLKLCGYIEREGLRAHLDALSRDIGCRRVGTEGEQKARQYIFSSLVDMGYRETSGTLCRQQLCSKDNFFTENIIAVVPSSSPEMNGVVVLSAHYDTVITSVGAIDNASGVATLLELARLIKATGTTFDYELRICFFASEEDGYNGAKKYIELLGDEDKARHIGQLNVDMSAFGVDDIPKAFVVSTKAIPTRTDDLPPVENAVSRAIERAHEVRSFDAAPFYCPSNAGKHDTVPFYHAGIPCANVSYRDIDFERAEYNEDGIATPWNNHTSDDNPDAVDLDSFYAASDLVLASLAELERDLKTI